MTGENSYINRQIGNYRVISELANGAFGRVYLAQHTVLIKRTVAIKLLHITHLGSAEERADFLREAQFLEELKHPYILPIFDVGIEDGFPYIVAEYASNGSLRDRIKSRAPHLLSFQEVLTILSQIGQALHYAHQRQVIHRDLKPENILFNSRNEALLADFGLATSLTTASIKQVDSAGTPRYMAPEQFHGNVSKESDQYGLACIAYELVTGRPPFTEKDFYSIGFKHLAENPTPPTQLNPYLPITIEHVILRAMAKQRADRYPDIASFISALLQSTGSQPAIMASSEMGITTLPASYSKGASSSEPQQMMPTISDSGPRSIPNSGPTIMASDPAALDAGIYNETPRYRNRNPLTPLPPVPELGSQTPFPASPLHDSNTVHNVASSQPRISSNTPIRSNARYVENNSAFLPASNWEGRHQRPLVKASSGYRWAFLAVLCLAIGAGIMAVLFLGIPAVFSPHSSGSTSGSSLAGGGTTVATTTPGNPSKHSTPTGKPTSQPIFGPTGQPTSHPTPQPNPSPTTAPTPTTPPPTPTPSPTPAPTSETLTVDFTNPNSVYTSHSYSGQVTISVSGAGGVAPLGWSDAFYEYIDFSGNAINPPQHTRCWVMYIDGVETDNFIPTPAYNSGHGYQFTITAPGGALGFVICDHTRSDNHGSLSVTVTGSASSSPVASVSPTSSMQVQAISTDMLAEENKNN